MESFRYEHTLELTESEFVALRSLFTRKTRPIRITLSLLLGLACLFSPYTVLLGLILLVLGAIALVAPRFLPATAARTFHETPHLHHPLTFVVSENGMQVRSADIDLESKWSNLRVWELREGWLRLAPSGMQELFFKVELLKEAGVYDAVMELAREHGIEFNSKKARKLKRQQSV